MRRGSPVLRKMETDGALTLVGAVYELQTGRVVFSKPLAVRAAH